MDFRGLKDTSFSPYHDDGGLIDFLDDDAQRFTVNAALVFFLHVGLAFALSGSFVVPDLKPPPPPEAVTVEIVTFDPVAPEPDPEPIVVEPAPVVAPPPAPQPKPQPRPQPQPVPQPRPEPTPPPVIEPEPEPLPEPEPVLTPPPPEILVQPEPEPEPLDSIIPEPEPLPEPEVQEPVELEPIVEIFEPLPEPVIEPEPILEPEPEILDVVEPVPEPIIEFIEPEPEPEIIEEPLPVIVDDLPPTAGVIEAEPLPDSIEPDPLPPEIVIEPEAELPPDPTPVTPDVIDPVSPEPEIIPTAPTVLASPEAPDTQEEERRAVPQEQSDPFLDLLKRDRDPSQSTPNLGIPTTGGGNEGPVGSVNTPPGGGTQLGRPNPGTGGWTLAPQRPGAGKAYEGLNLDIRCREAGRTHADCPEYLRKNRGRAADGSESWNGMAGTGTDRGNRISGSRSIPSRGSLGVPIGDNSVNGGGPSTGALDFQDTNFDREFLGKDLYQLEPEQGLLGKVFDPKDPVDEDPSWVFDPPAEDQSEDEDDLDWVLEKLPE